MDIYIYIERVLKRLSLAAAVAALCVTLCAGCTSKGYEIISGEEAAQQMEKGGCLVVDVRTAVEYETAHIPGAVLVPLDDIRDGKLDALPDKDQLLLLYCYTGRRAEDAAALLADAGYKNVRSFGGIVDWTGETVTGKAPG